MWKCRTPGATLRDVNLRPILFFLCTIAVAARADNTALAALKLLPKDVAKRLARIEARDGRPQPERWYLLVHDPAAPNGMREIVVTGGKLAASRTLSQFADSLQPAEVVGAASVKVDSDMIVRLVASFVVANGARFGALSYELGKDVPTGIPHWRVAILDPKGVQVGVLVIDASKGTVLSHEGFEKEPASELLGGVKPSPIGTSGGSTNGTTRRKR